MATTAYPNKKACKKSVQNGCKTSHDGMYAGSTIGSPEMRVFILVALARVNMSHWFNIMTRLASFYRK